MRSTGLQVPKDIQTILHEYKVARPILGIENRSYLYLGIYNIVQPHLVKEIDSISNNITIKLSFSIDGLPLAKSFKIQFWPILLSFINVPIFQIKYFQLLYSFKGKPGDVNEYSHPFINELNSLLTYGIKINDKQIHFEVAHIVADALAKAYLLQVKIIMAILVVLTT